MQKPPPPRPRSKSSDDLDGVASMDAAESRARAALRLMNEERAAREAAEVARAAAEAEVERMRLAEVERQLSAVTRAAATPIKVESAPETRSPSSMRPGVLMVQAKGLKVGIPLAMLTPVLAVLWAGYQSYTNLQRQVKELQTVVTSYEKRFAKYDELLTATRTEQAEQRETQANLAGWLIGVMPKAGVNVPGVGIEVKSDPLPPGARRQTPVNVRTPVPTPPPF